MFNRYLRKKLKFTVIARSEQRPQKREKHIRVIRFQTAAAFGVCTWKHQQTKHFNSEPTVLYTVPTSYEKHFRKNKCWWIGIVIGSFLRMWILCTSVLNRIIKYNYGSVFIIMIWWYRYKHANNSSLAYLTTATAPLKIIC